MDTRGRTQPRAPQLAYSELQPVMLDEQSRRKKAGKVIRVVEHFLGRDDLAGLRAVDIGCSAGFIADELTGRGAKVTGLDIDVSGLKQARTRFGQTIEFLESSGESIPLPKGSTDIVLYNHIYEHVVDPESVMTEVCRILKPDGVVYLGLANRFGVIEPHHKLPFLSWLPPGMADRYVRAIRKAPAYHERLRGRRDLLRMCEGLNVWDYTYTILAEPQRFAADEMVSGVLTKVPVGMWRWLSPIIPTFIWVGTAGERSPAGRTTIVPPVRLRTPGM